MKSLLNKVSDKTVGYSCVVGIVIALFLIATPPANAWSFDNYQPYSYGSGSYESRDARTVQSAKVGRVLDIRSVEIEAQASDSSRNIGRSIGAIVGAVGGNKLTQNNPTLWGLGFGALGGLLGDGIAQKVAGGTRAALEVTVEMKDGQTLVVVQQDDGSPLSIGDRVRLITGSNSRVVRIGG